MLVTYPLIGIAACAPPPPRPAIDVVLYLKGGGITARGRDTAEGFVVLEGSQAAIQRTDSLHEYVRAQRQTVVANGVLVASGATLPMAQGYTFNSRSTAAAVLLARVSNGRTEWKDSAGRTLTAIQELAAS